MTGRYFKSANNIISIAFSSLMGFVSFYISDYLIYKLDLNLLSATIIFFIIFFMNILILKNIKVNQIIKKNKKILLQNF